VGKGGVVETSTVLDGSETSRGINTNRWGNQVITVREGNRGGRKKAGKKWLKKMCCVKADETFRKERGGVVSQRRCNGKKLVETDCVRWRVGLSGRGLSMSEDGTVG